METRLPDSVLAVAAPVPLEQPIPMPAAVPGRSKRISDVINSVLFYGTLAFGIGFPIVATIYALIVY